MNTQDTGALKTSRRTLVKGAAWSVPVVAVGASAAHAAASVCSPEFTAQPGSVKCCKGPINTMKLIIKVTDTAGCVPTGELICIDYVVPSNGGSVETTTFDPSQCVEENQEVTVYLYNVSNCTVNLTVGYHVGDGAVQEVALKSTNLVDGENCTP